jgi:hypothetical protein
MYTPSDLDNEITDILYKGNQYVFPNITATLHTPDRDIILNNINHLDIDMNYNSDLSDKITIDFMFRLGDYRDIILKYRNTLEITISIDYAEDNGDRSTTDTGIYNRQSIILREKNKGDKPLVYRYRFISLVTDERFKNSIYTKMSSEDLNNLDVIVVKGECVDPIILALKQYVISGIYRNYKLEDVIKGLLQKYLNKLSIDDDKFKYKFNILPLDNNTIYDHIIIKSNTKLIQLPYILQDQDYGLYNGHVNLYISRDIDNNYILNLYPLYDVAKYDTTPNNRLMLYSADKPSKSFNEVTYYKESKASKDIKIVVSDISILDTGLNDTISLGDGLFNVNPNLVLDESLKAFNSTKMYYNTEELLTKEVNEDNITRITRLIDTNQDDNLYKYRSKILKTLNTFGTVTIPKSDIRIFIPGMYLQYLYNHDNTVVIKRGMVQNVSTTFNIVKKTSVSLINFSMEK